VRVTDVSIAPPLNSRRLTSAGRDGFHCKDNRAQMIFERCRLAGLRDDCFNISSMTAVPHERVSDRELVVKRSWYPNLDYAAFGDGDLVALFDEDSRTITWCGRVARAADFEQGSLKLTRLTFAADLPALAAQTLVLNEAVASPGAIIRFCDIQGSCRLRSQMLIEDSVFTGFTWFTAERVEGPFPRRVMIRNSHFINRDVRHNRGDCLMFALPGLAPARGPEYERHDLALEHNVFDGAVVMNQASGVTMIGNDFRVARRFSGPAGPDVVAIGNSLGGQAWSPPDQRSAPDPQRVSLIWPFACFVGRLPGDAENRHVASLGSTAVARWVRHDTGAPSAGAYQFQPPAGGEVGVELELDSRLTRLTIDLRAEGLGQEPLCVVYGVDVHDARRPLPITRHGQPGEGLIEVDLTAAPLFRTGRRRIDVIVPAGAGPPPRVTIDRLTSWSTP